jgi:hypothetical protein
MGQVKRILRGGTRNQSTADYQRENLFIYDNRYYEATLINKEVADLTLEEGILVKRDLTDPTRVEAIVSDTEAELQKVVGVVSFRGEQVIAQNGTVNVTFCYKGDLDVNLLVYPGAATINTVVGDKILKDVLTDLGFSVHNVTENTNFDN